MELNSNTMSSPKITVPLTEEEKLRKKKITRAIRRVITGDNKSPLPPRKKYELGMEGENAKNSSNFSARKNLKGLTLSIAEN